MVAQTLSSLDSETDVVPYVWNARQSSRSSRGQHRTLLLVVAPQSTPSSV